MDQRNFFYKLLYERNSSPCQPVSLYNAAKNNLYLLQRMCLEKKLDVHSGCVNTICWNSTGQYLLSGSDDLHLCITDAFTNEIKASIRTGHATNIFSAKYLPGTGDSQVISCSGDGVIIYTDLNRPETATKNIFDCQEESVYDIATVPNDSHTFLTCSHDQTVRWYDLRVKTSCLKHPPPTLPSRYGGRRLQAHQHRCTEDVLIRAEYPVTAIAVNGLMPWQLAIGCSDSIVRIYDRRMLSTKSLGGGHWNADSSVLAKFTYDGITATNRITSLAYSRNCQQLLASFSNDFLYLFDLNDVRNTIKLSADEDIIPDKSDKPNCNFKRFRLRGDWSDTGPNALTSDEIRAANTDEGGSSSAPARRQQAQASTTSTPSAPLTAPTTSSLANSNTTTSSTSSARAPESSTAAGSVASASTGERGRTSEARIRHLNNILSLFLRNSFRGSNSSNMDSGGGILAQGDRGQTDEQSSDSSSTHSNASSTAAQRSSTSTSTSTSTAATVSGQSSSDTVTSESNTTTAELAGTSTTTSSLPPLFPLPSAPHTSFSSSVNSHSGGRASWPSANVWEDSGNAQAGDNNSANSSSSANQSSFYIRLFDDTEWSRPRDFNWRREQEEGVLGNADELMDDDDDEDEDVDSDDATNDSVFHHTSRTSPLRTSSSADHSSRARPFSSMASNSGRAATSSRFDTVYETFPERLEDEEESHSNKYRRTEESVEREKRNKTYKIKNYQCFKGHRNARTVIKEATFWGDDYIVSGSDCGHIFFWSIKDQRLVMITEGDHHVVNCLQPHPTDPILASSGIDYDIKIWSPQSEESKFDEKKAKKIMDRNKTLLEESRDTVTVPARFVLSLFSTLRNRQNTISRNAAAAAAAAASASNEAAHIIADGWNNEDDDEDDDERNMNNNNMDEDVEVDL